MNIITTADGTRLYFKDWGTGPTVVFSHGWPLSSDSWESQMLYLAGHGYRCVAHDRRGHGRSSQPWNGNDMSTYADDLATVIETLKLERVTLVGFSTGGGEVARYIGRHGTHRVAKAALISAIPPLMLKTPENPHGVPIEVPDGLRKASLEDRSKLYQELASGPFFGFNRPGAKVSQGMIDSFWLQGMQAGQGGRGGSISDSASCNSVQEGASECFAQDFCSLNREACWAQGTQEAKAQGYCSVNRGHG